MISYTKLSHLMLYCIALYCVISYHIRDLLPGGGPCVPRQMPGPAPERQGQGAWAQPGFISRRQFRQHLSSRRYLSSRTRAQPGRGIHSSMRSIGPPYFSWRRPPGASPRRLWGCFRDTRRRARPASPRAPRRRDGSVPSYRPCGRRRPRRLARLCGRAGPARPGPARFL